MQKTQESYYIIEQHIKCAKNLCYIQERKIYSKLLDDII